MKMSPSSIASPGPIDSIVLFTISGKTLPCVTMYGPTETSEPSASMTAAAASLPVMSTFEPEQRMYWMPISSLIIIRRWLRTSKVTGSTVCVLLVLAKTGAPLVLGRNMGVAETVDPGALSRMQDDRRAGMLDHGRTRNLDARAQRPAIVDGRIHHAELVRAEGGPPGTRLGGLPTVHRLGRRLLDRTDGVEAVIDAFDSGVLERRARPEEPLVFRLEGRRDLSYPALAVDECGRPHADRIDLAPIARLDPALEPPIHVGYVRVREKFAALLLHARVNAFELFRRDGQGQRVRVAEAEAHVREPAAVGRMHRGVVRDDDGLYPEVAAVGGGVDGSGSAIGHHGEAAGIVAALERGLADEIRHLSVDDAPDARRGCDHIASEERTRDPLLDGGGGKVRAKRHATAKEPVGRDVAEHDVGVGDSRLLAALPVAGRTGVGRSALRADPKPAVVDPGDRAASRPNRYHVDHGQP